MRKRDLCDSTPSPGPFPEASGKGSAFPGIQIQPRTLATNEVSSHYLLGTTETPRIQVRIDISNHSKSAGTTRGSPKAYDTKPAEDPPRSNPRLPTSNSLCLCASVVKNPVPPPAMCNLHHARIHDILPVILCDSVPLWLKKKLCHPRLCAIPTTFESAPSHHKKSLCSLCLCGENPVPPPAICHSHHVRIRAILPVFLCTSVPLR